MTRICIFGDSIVWGSYDPKGGGWVNRLRNHYESLDEDLGVYNLGICGDNTDGLLKRLEVEAAAREPDLIIFAIGINDSQFVHSKNEHRVPLEQFKQNLEEIFDISKKFTDKIMFIGLTNVEDSKTTPIPWNTDKSYKSEFVKEYDKAIADFCESRGIPFLRMFDLLSKEELCDGVHPNTQGHIKMFKRTKDFIDKNI